MCMYFLPYTCMWYPASKDNLQIYLMQNSLFQNLDDIEIFTTVFYADAKQSALEIGMSLFFVFSSW